MSSTLGLQEILKSSFNDSIVAVSETAPYTTIQNRAKVTRSLKAIGGVERIMIRGVNKLNLEFGPNGESVYEADNKDARIRFVGGGIQSLSDNNGSYVGSQVSGDYVEISFYGTGLNLLGILNATARDYRITVDGGAEGTNVYPTGLASTLGGRSSASNQILQIASSLSLGLHTVKIRNNSTNPNGMWIYGFEILNQRSDVGVYPGTAIADGKIIGLSSLSSSSFKDGVSGIRGARVVKYLDGISVNSAVQHVDGSTKYLTLADHTNEEVLRRINFREFGAGRSSSDDFSTLTSSASSRVFTLDDGTTTLIALNGKGDNSFSSSDALRITAAGTNFITFTFIGTGLDLFICTDTVTRTSDCYIDGTLVGTISKAGSTSSEIRKICSGLTYGTHTVKLLNTSASNDSFGIIDYILYQPKKPSIPDGSIEIADYNVLADYAIAAEGIDTVSTGVIRKQNTREMIYSGTWSGPTIGVGSTISGFISNTTTTSSYIQYTFWGTGFDYRVNSEATQVQTLTLDGSSSFSSYTTQFVHAGATWNSANGTITGNGGVGGLLSVRGLTLGLHTIKITLTTGGAGMYPECFDIITPIHINSTDLKTGSLSLRSNTISTPVITNKTKWQKKTYSGTLASFSFNNLEIGKTYRLTLYCGSNTDAVILQVILQHNGVDLMSSYLNNGTGVTNSSSIIFTAVSPTIICTQATGLDIGYAFLEELPNHEQTNQW